jgi:hypothetical protein
MRSPILLALLLTTPAAAQIAGRHDYGDVGVHDPLAQEGSNLPAPGVRRNLRHIDSRIDAARESGRITRREARALRREARLIGRLAGNYASNGLSASESAELEFRARVLTSRIALPSQGGSQGGGRSARR